MPLRLSFSSSWNSSVPLRQQAFTIKHEGVPTRRLAAFAMLLLFCALPYAALGQSGPSGQLGFLRHSRSMSSMPMMPSLFPLFIEDGSISSRLTLVNATGLQTYATLTVRDEAGQAWQSQRITLAPHAQVQLEVASLLSGMGLHLASGSILLNQGPSPMSQSIVGQLTLYSASSPVSYAEEEEFMPAMMPSNLLLSVAEASDQSPMVAITSTSSADQHATIQCTRNGAKSTHHITLPPNGQSIIEPCDSSEAANPEEHAGPSYPAAIRITTDGPAGELSAFGLTRHQNPSSGAKYLGALQFLDPASLNSSSLVFSGISSGRSLTPLNASTYTSQIAIANFGDTASNVDVEVYRASSANQTTPVSKKLKVPPSSVVQLHLGTLMASPQDVASVVVSTTASPGTILAKLISTGDSAPYQLEQLAKDALDEHNGGIHPWSLENSSLSDLLLFNHSDSSQAFSVVIEAPGGVEWVKHITIASHHTIDLSIDNLIAAKVTDDRGKLLPSSATHGTVIWSTDLGVGTGRMLIRNSAAFAAQSFSCGQAYVVCGGYFDDIGAIGLEDEETLNANADYCVDYSGGFECTGDYAYSEYFQGGWVTWSSSNHNIATVQGSGGSASVTGVALGTATIDAAMTDTYGCSADATADIDVTPRINSISPARGLVGTPINVTITGYGFASGDSVYAGSNIVVSNVNVNSSSQITATFTPSNSTSAGGNQSVTVNYSGETSNSENFFVQYPLHLVYVDETSTPNNGHSATISGTDINIPKVDGTIAASGVCGGYQLLSYDVTDQNGNPINNGTVTFNESFSNDSPSPDPLQGPPTPGAAFNLDLSKYVLGDVQALWNKTPPACPPANQSDSYNQQWTPTIGSVTYPLTTVISITRSTNSQGLPSFNISITTP